MINVLWDKVLVKQPARHPDGVAEASFVKRTLMVGQSGLFPRAFSVTHNEKGFRHGNAGPDKGVGKVAGAAKISKI
jgi:hypothetical protein